MRRWSCGVYVATWVGLLTAGLFATSLAVIESAKAADDFKLEPGFSLVFNGKDLTGWETKPGTALEGKTAAFDGRFTVRDEMLVVDPKVKGDVIIQTTKKFAKNVHLKFDFLPGTGCNNDLFLRGIKFDIKKEDIKNIKFDEWNSFEIVITGDEAQFLSNGEVQKKTSAKAEPSPLGIRAEFGAIQFRRIRVKEE